MPEINKIRVGATIYDIGATPMTGATESADGSGGSVPTPVAGDNEKYLCGDGTWKEPPGGGADSNLGYEAYKNENNEWVLPIGTDAEIGDYIAVDGVLGRALREIIGGTTVIEPNVNWLQETDGGLNSLKATINTITVHKTGNETVGGEKTFTDEHVISNQTGRVSFKGVGNDIATGVLAVGGLGSNNEYGNPQFRIVEYSPTDNGTDTTGRYEAYLLPSVETGKTSNSEFAILTSKTPVSVEQGGTGSTSPSEARIALGLGASATQDVVAIENGGTGSTSPSDARTALGAFSTTGGTITGNVTVQTDTIPIISAKDSGTSVEAQLYVGSGHQNHGLYSPGYYDTSFHASGTWMIYRNNTGGVVVNGNATNVTGVVGPANGGTGKTSLALARNAMGLGNTTGALPPANGGTGQTSLALARNAMGLGNTTGAVPVPNGGTGATNASGARTNLGLGSAATVSVPISPGNGGTGQTTLALARNAMGLGNTTGAVPPANGGTGQTTLALARNAMGLGNTTGALPIANGGTGATSAPNARTALGLGSASTVSVPISPGNGGTGQTTLALARNAMGLGNTTGALPIANGGTGKTNASDARTALGIGAAAVDNVVTPAHGGTGKTTLALARDAMGLGNTTGALPIANGGTGKTNASLARTALGLGTAATVSVPIAITNGGTGKTSASDARTALGLGSAATRSVANNLTTSSSGSSVLDAYQGKVLNDAITTVSTASVSGVGITYNARKLGKIVVVTFNGKNTSALSYGTLIATLPSGFRPAGSFYFVSSNRGDNRNDSFAVYTDGSIKATNSSSSGNNQCGEFIFITA